jgi:hypothetical protein
MPEIIGLRPIPIPPGGGDNMAKIQFIDSTDKDEFIEQLEKYTEDKWDIVNSGVTNYSLTLPSQKPVEIHYWALLKNEG